MTNLIAAVTFTLITNWISTDVYLTPNCYHIRVGRVYTNVSVKVEGLEKLHDVIPSAIFITKVEPFKPGEVMRANQFSIDAVELPTKK